MKNFLLKIFGFNEQQTSNNVYMIEKNKPSPIRNVKYRDLLRIMETMKKLPINGSFTVKNELNYPVRKIAKEHYPEYKIIIRPCEGSIRVFRKA